MSQSPSPSKPTSRRAFLRNSSLLVAGGAIAASQVQIARAAHAFGSDTIKVGLIGCGGRGTGAANQAMNTSGGEVKLVAMADAFADRLQQVVRGHHQASTRTRSTCPRTGSSSASMPTRNCCRPIATW